MIETGIAWLAGWWPLLALPGAFVAGFGMGWLMRREDMIQAQRELKRRADAYHKLADMAVAVGEQRDSLIQALRALIEQHTVRQEKA